MTFFFTLMMVPKVHSNKIVPEDGMLQMSHASDIYLVIIILH